MTSATGGIVPSTLDWAETPTSFTPSSRRSRSERSSSPSGGEGDPADLDAPLGGQDLPGDDVGVVLEVAEQDDVARLEPLAAVAVGHQVDALGGVAGEDQLGVAAAADEAADPAPGLLHGLGGLLGQPVGAPVHVGVGRLVVLVHGVEHGPGLLRGGGRVEVDEVTPGGTAPQDGEVLLDPLDVERRRGRGGGGQRHDSYPSASSRCASSGPPESTIRPSTSKWTRSGGNRSNRRW